MQTTINLLDVEETVIQFLQKHQIGISTLHRMYVQDQHSLSLLTLIEQLKDELKTGVITYYNSHNHLNDVDSYLFYIVNVVCKQINKAVGKKQAEYICPGCLFLGTVNLVSQFDKLCFKCDNCSSQAKSSQDSKELFLFKTFAVHHKLGYRCPDCSRFLPHPMESKSIVCPYFDCCFVGDYDQLKRMYHTTSKNNPEKLILDVFNEEYSSSSKNNLVSGAPDALIFFQDKQELENKVKLLQDIIFSQNSHVAYTSNDYTIKHKQLVYQAFSTLLKQFPQEMVSYLLDGSRSGGFQHKVFQEYIRLLEEALPFFIKKGSKHYCIDNLLSEHLCIFNGISIFNSFITPKLEIKNETTEFYIGGRKASYTQRYYIGKLLNVIRQDTKEPILHLVKEYTFSRIRLQNVSPHTPVIVTHLRIPPHYQMGGMVYVNRVRKKIVDRAITMLHKE